MTNNFVVMTEVFVELKAFCLRLIVRLSRLDFRGSASKTVGSMNTAGFRISYQDPTIAPKVVDKPKCQPVFQVERPCPSFKR
jgi:hypothetical protein